MASTPVTKKQKHTQVLRLARKLHRSAGALLFIFFFFISISGVLLGWKKHSNGFLLAKTYEGTSSDIKTWLPLDSLMKIATQTLHDSVSKDLSIATDRIDLRPEKGMAKFSCKEEYLSLQIDCSTGKLLHIEKRRADFIEHIHDGSILDKLLGIKNGTMKLIYTTVTGLALLLFTITGFWLWYGPKYLRKLQ